MRTLRGHPRSRLAALQGLQTALLLSFLVATVPAFGGARLVPRFAVAIGGAALVVARGWGIRAGQRPALIVVGGLLPVLGLGSLFWSWESLLTLSKAALLICVFLVGVLGGFEMALRSRKDGDVLLPWAIAGVAWVAITTLGVQSGGSYGGTGFRGGTGNENMFGIGSAVFAFPLAEYLLVSRWARHWAVQILARASPWIWGALIVTSKSRSGMSVFLALAFCWWLTVGRERPERWVVPGAGGVLLLSLLLGVDPVVARTQELVFKSSVGEQDLFYSRRAPWLDTEAAISLVGPLGAGLGVAADQPFHRDDISWATTVGYGREHGSAWLALREQLGIPGQLVYALLGVTLALTLAKAVPRARSLGGGMAAPMLLSVAFGLYGASFVEAWTVAPGSAPSGFFWAALGQGAGAYARLHARASRRSARRSASRLSGSLQRIAPPQANGIARSRISGKSSEEEGGVSGARTLMDTV